MISFVIATSGRASIQHTLISIETYDGDEIVVVGGEIDVPASVDCSRVRHIPCPLGNDWGHTERNYAASYLTGRYIAHIDDDDVYVEGTRAQLAKAIEDHPHGPSIFRMQYPDGRVLWSGFDLCLGNIGTPMTLWPNVPDKLGTWGPFHGGDFHYVQTMKWARDEVRWWPTVIARLGHN